MPKCTADEMIFGRLGRRVIEAHFRGGAISSDGGVMLLRQLDRRLGLSHAVAQALSGPRDKGPHYAHLARSGGPAALRSVLRLRGSQRP